LERSYSDTGSLMGQIKMAAMLRDDATLGLCMEKLLKRTAWVSAYGHNLLRSRPE
jgi:hypothetical protein